MKRILWFTLGILLTASLILPGCGGGTTPSTAPPAKTTAAASSPASSPKPSAPASSAPASPTAVAKLKVRVATDATWAPFEYVNETTKKIEGFDIDLFNAIANASGLELEYVNVQFDPLLAGMAKGQYDAAISSITITEDRKKDMLFSDPYFAAGQIVTVRKTNTTITGNGTLTGKVGAQIGTTGAIEVGKMTNVTLKTYDDIGLCFQDLINGQIDAVVCDTPVAMDYVGKNPDKIKMVGTAFTDENYGIAVAKGKTDLLAKINAGIKVIKAEGLPDKLAQKWIMGGNK